MGQKSYPTIPLMTPGSICLKFPKILTKRKGQSYGKNKLKATKKR